MVSIRMGRDKEKAVCITRMEVSTKDIGKMVINLALEHTHTLMEMFMKENGKTTKNMEKEFIGTKVQGRNLKVRSAGKRIWK